MPSSNAEAAWGCLSLLMVAALVVLLGWVFIVEAPRFAAEKAVCFDRGGVYAGEVLTAHGTEHPGCIRPVVPLDVDRPRTP